jgi:23S rRNA G2069 N7-methylase RlmK/C1962 C5-methylase RlmI
MLIARFKQMSELNAKKISNAMKNERNKIIKNSNTYKSKKQIELDYFLRRCNQNFEIRSVIYRLDLDRVLYV